MWKQNCSYNSRHWRDTRGHHSGDGEIMQQAVKVVSNVLSLVVRRCQCRKWLLCWCWSNMFPSSLCVILLQVWTLFLCTLAMKCLHSTFPSAGGWQTANPTLNTWPRTLWPQLFGFSSLTCCSERKSSGRFRRRGQRRMPEDIVSVVGAGGKAENVLKAAASGHRGCTLWDSWNNLGFKVCWLLSRIHIFNERMRLRSVSEQCALILF